ncbi:MAG TPA: DUF3306 domain-containing protein [Burkholderiaceae bacterium]|nr:DUF3306 domain-containing protein [Burkholderiaceae bacterium]
MSDHAPPVDARDGFVSRWARRKAQARAETVAPAEVPTAPLVPVLPVAEAPVAAPANPDAVVPEPAPTLADVALLTRASDYSRFVAGGVDEGVKRAALKKLFSDPHFNVMDGLDTYIDDYGQPDPIPLAMLRQMNQSKVLRLFDDEDEEEAQQSAAATVPTSPVAIADPTEESPSPPDDHADLRLQQDDVAGRPGPDQGPRA